MASEENGAFIRNIAEVPWREFPNHFGGALVEAAGDAGDRRLAPPRLPDFDVSADGACRDGISIRFRSRSTTCSKARG